MAPKDEELIPNMIRLRMMKVMHFGKGKLPSSGILVGSTLSC